MIDVYESYADAQMGMSATTCWYDDMESTASDIYEACRLITKLRLEKNDLEQAIYDYTPEFDLAIRVLKEINQTINAGTSKL